MRRPAALLCALLLTACASSSELEGAQTRVNVWLTVPALAQEGGTIEALIYVGPYKVVQGPVVFPKGTPTVNLTPLFIGAGPRDVSAVLRGGRLSATETVDIERESWIQVVVEGTSVRIEFDDEQPDPWG